MTLDEANATIDRLVADLARATGRSESLVRLTCGLDLVGSEYPQDTAA